MTRRVAFAGLLALALATQARAAFITGVTASTNMGVFVGSTGNSDIAHIVDGSGLSSPPTLTSTHAAGDIFTNAWASAIVTFTGQVKFDLHGSYMLAGMSVWNFNGADFTAGVLGVSVSTSTDGMTFT